MRKYTLSAGALPAMLSVLMSAPAMAQDTGPPLSEGLETPAAAPQLDPDQQVIFDAWPPEQQAMFASWPANVQTYYWSLPVPRQELFWRLTDNDKVALATMRPDNRAAAWEMVEKRLQNKADAQADPMNNKPAGS